MPKLIGSRPRDCNGIAIDCHRRVMGVVVINTVEVKGHAPIFGVLTISPRSAVFLQPNRWPIFSWPFTNIEFMNADLQYLYPIKRASSGSADPAITQSHIDIETWAESLEC